MKYVPPVGGADNDPYVDGNPSTGVEGSPVPAAAIEDPMRELVALISDVGLTPDEADLTQVTSAVRMATQRLAASSAAAAGTANAITAAFSPSIAALTNGMTLHVRASAANTSTTPTFTPADGLIGAKTIVKGNNLPLVAGDIAGVGHWIELKYDTTLDKWVIQNPATFAQFTSSLSGNGYQKLPNGLIIQWGSATTSGGGASVSFPIAFPTQCYAVIASVNAANVNKLVSTGAFILTGFPAYVYQANTNANSDATFDWVAFGK